MMWWYVNSGRHTGLVLYLTDGKEGVQVLFSTRRSKQQSSLNSCLDFQIRLKELWIRYYIVGNFGILSAELSDL